MKKNLGFLIGIFTFALFSFGFVFVKDVQAQQCDPQGLKTCLEQITTFDIANIKICGDLHCEPDPNITQEQISTAHTCIAERGITDGNKSNAEKLKILYGCALDNGFSFLAGIIFIPKPTGALSSIPAILSGAIQLILIIAGLIAFVYLLLGGMKWISSGGDKGEVETARNQIIQALIGLIVVLAAWGLIILVQAMTGVCLGFGCDVTIPKLF